MNYSSLALFALVVLLLKFFGNFLSVWQRNPPFPPGPSPQLVVGNLRDLSTKHPWLTYTEWGVRYGGFSDSGRVAILSIIKGDLVHASTLGQHIVIVNSVKTAFELFEKRSHIYSDRPVVPVLEM